MPAGNGPSRYRVVVGQEPSDLEWDHFVAAAVGGAYQQSSMWAEVKATLGWRCARLVLRGPEGIVAGCQVLLRPVPWLGAIAYVPRGPLAAGHDPRTLECLLEALDELALQERILYLKLQPPPGRGDIAAALPARGFVPSEFEIAPTVTVRVDLRRSPEALLGAMRRNARTNIRKAQRLGVRIREGAEPDLGAFTRLVEVTARRQRFSAYPPTYYEQIWRTFAARGHARLLVAEHDGVTKFKLGFGGEVTAFPGTYDRAYQPADRRAPPGAAARPAGAARAAGAQDTVEDRPEEVIA